MLQTLLTLHKDLLFSAMTSTVKDTEDDTILSQC